MTPRELARLATQVENGAPETFEYLATAPEGNGLIVGVTGPPGAGKSSLVDALTAEMRRRGKTVAIIAVDPSSRISGGAILGDRVRMQRHHADPGVFIRSMATRGATGGLARTSAALSRLFRSAGFDFVIIETVGVGQDEVDVAALADVTVVVLVPGMGDEVQTIKAGIMEIADVFVINKSDRDGAERVEREIRAMQSLAMRSDNWTPPIVKTVASDGTGVPDVLKAIDSYRTYLSENNLGTRRRVENWRKRIAQMLRDALFQRVVSDYLGDGQADRIAAEVAEHKRDPYSLVEEIVRELGKRP